MTRRYGVGGVVIGVAALAVTPLFTGSKPLLTTLILVFIYGTVATSWNLLAGYGGQVSLGHAAFFGIGALIARTLIVGGAPVAVALPLGGLAAALASLIVGWPVFRLRGVYFAIGTLAVAEMMRLAVGAAYPHVSSLPVTALASYSLPARYYAAFVVALGVTAGVWWLLRTRRGFGLLAVRDDESAAAAIGIEPLHHKLLALAIAALGAGLAGAAFAYYQLSYYHAYAFSPLWTFEAVMIVYVGGAGTLAGPWLGTLVYLLLRSLLTIWLPDAHLYVFGVLFLLTVLRWPGGLLRARLRS